MQKIKFKNQKNIRLEDLEAKHSSDEICSAIWNLVFFLALPFDCQVGLGKRNFDKLAHRVPKNCFFEQKAIMFSNLREMLLIFVYILLFASRQYKIVWLFLYETTTNVCVIFLKKITTH